MNPALPVSAYQITRCIKLKMNALASHVHPKLAVKSYITGCISTLPVNLNNKLRKKKTVPQIATADQSWPEHVSCHSI
jgi:hypothetical protein